MSKTVEEEVREVLHDFLAVPEEQIQLNSRFEEDLGGDSLDRVEVVMELEERFCLEVPDEDSEKLCTVQDMITYIESKQKGGA